MGRRPHALALAMCVALACALLAVTPIGLAFEEHVGLSWLFKLRGPVSPPPGVAIVNIDEGSAARLDLPDHPRDWPRSVHAALIEALVQRGAALIVFDLAFTTPRDAAEDVILARALRAAGRVLLVEDTERSSQVAVDADRRSRDIWLEKERPPIPVLAENALGRAPFRLPAVPARVARFWTFVGDHDDRPTLPMLAVRALAGKASATAGDRTVEAPVARSSPGDGERSAPRQDGREWDEPPAFHQAPHSRYLNFYGPPGTIPHVPYDRLLRPQEGQSVPALEGSVVFVGYSELAKVTKLDGFTTVFTTPDGINMSGVEIAATAFANLRTGRALRPLDPLATLALVLTLGGLFGSGAFLPSWRAHVLAMTGAGVAYGLSAHLLFDHLAVWLPLATPLLVQFPVTLIASSAQRYRSAQRQQRFLEEENRAVAATSQGKSEFLAVMSHEIRTPLHCVGGLMELLEDTPLDAQQKQLVDQARRSSQDLLDLLNQALDFSKAEVGEVRLVIDAVDLPALVRSVMDAFMGVAHRKGLTLDLAIADRAPTIISSDALRLRQIISNLVGNAIKFTLRGGVWISVDVETRPQDEPRLAIAIRDSGIGVSRDDLPRVFLPFRQSRSSTQPHGAGTGLGLPISLRLAELFGGTIDVESTPNVGSVFTLRVPLAVPSRERNAPFPAAVAEDGRPRWTFGDHGVLALAPPWTVLVADDDPASRFLIAGQLKKLGFRAYLCADGIEAWRYLQEQAVDVLITDRHMPRLDGLALARRIRGEERFAGVRILALSADVSDGARRACREAGVDDVLSKPTTLDDLSRVLARLAATARPKAPIAADGDGDDNPARALPAADDAARSALPHLDPSNLLAAFGTVDDSVRAMLTAFMRQTLDFLRDMRAHAARAEAVPLRQLAHRVAGSCLSLGAKRLGALCGDLERDARSGNWTTIAATLARVDRAVVDLGRAIDAFAEDARSTVHDERAERPHRSGS